MGKFWRLLAFLFDSDLIEHWWSSDLDASLLVAQFLRSRFLLRSGRYSHLVTLVLWKSVCHVRVIFTCLCRGTARNYDCFGTTMRWQGRDVHEYMATSQVSEFLFLLRECNAYKRFDVRCFWSRLARICFVIDCVWFVYSLWIARRVHSRIGNIQCFIPWKTAINVSQANTGRGTAFRHSSPLTRRIKAASLNFKS